jgi:hypothetical protein
MCSFEAPMLCSLAFSSASFLAFSSASFFAFSSFFFCSAMDEEAPRISPPVLPIELARLRWMAFWASAGDHSAATPADVAFFEFSASNAIAF